MANTGGIVVALLIMVSLVGAYVFLQPTLDAMTANNISYVAVYYIANVMIGGISLGILLNSLKTGHRK